MVLEKRNGPERQAVRSSLFLCMECDPEIRICFNLTLLNYSSVSLFEVSFVLILTVKVRRVQRGFGTTHN
jgi:hypothetical protein